MKSLLVRISQWADAALWHTWVVHGLVALPLSVLGWRAVLAAFALREGEQIAWALMGRLKWEPWYDYPMDVLAPTLVAWLVSLL